MSNGNGKEFQQRRGSGIIAKKIVHGVCGSSK